MYACNRETRRGFFEGVCTPSNATAIFRDPPAPGHSRIDYGRRGLAAILVRVHARLLKRPSEKPLVGTLINKPAAGHYYPASASL